MCGRYTLKTSPQAVAEAFGLADMPLFTPRYNIAPTQLVATVSLDRGRRALYWRRWGLVPSWADDPAIGNRLINARADTVADKPSFRGAFKKQRCLIVADGFYEWKKIGKTKQPYYVRMRDGRPFGFAGLAENWRRGELAIDSCSLITTEPNSVMAAIHDRMPVILPPDQWPIWLDPTFEDRAKLLAMLRPYLADDLIASPVGMTVNNPRNEGPGCIEERPELAPETM